MATIADLIEELRAARSNSVEKNLNDPAYQAAGHRLVAALAECGPVIYGRMIYRSATHPGEGWCVVIEALPGVDKLMPWAVRLGWRAARPADYPSGMTLSRRYDLPLASMTEVPLPPRAVHAGA